ncbi:hypothetical protein [Undibacterium sp. JH2W]|uniref:hypothetical protein n=1 Tax=Undibacterium sp. JH2W TaxID=3413037 RepID=UPI003BF478A4
MRLLLSLVCFAVCTTCLGEQVVQREVLYFSSSLTDAGEAFAESKNLLEKLCQQNGLICKLTAYPPGRALKMLQESETAGELPRFEEFLQMAPTATRVPTAIGQLSFSVLTHDKNLIIKSLADLSKKKVFYVRGNAAIAAHKELEQLIAVNSEHDCAYMVLRNHGDACIMTKSLAMKILAGSEHAPDTYLLQDLFFKPVYLYLSPRYKYLQDIFDQSLKHWRPDERIAQ